MPHISHLYANIRYLKINRSFPDRDAMLRYSQSPAFSPLAYVIFIRFGGLPSLSSSSLSGAFLFFFVLELPLWLVVLVGVG